MFLIFYNPMGNLFIKEESDAFTEKVSFEIRNVEWGDDCLLVQWKDGDRTFISGNGDDREKLLALAYAKKALGNNSRYREKIFCWLKCTKEMISTTNQTQNDQKITPQTKTSNQRTTEKHKSLYDEMKSYFTKTRKNCENCWFGVRGKCVLEDGYCKERSMWAQDDRDMLDFYGNL